MTSPWTIVFTGPPHEVLIVQAQLDANRIPTFVPDANTKFIDPFITGANALMMDLMAPEDRAAEVAEILEARTPDEVAAEEGAEAAPDEWDTAEEVEWRAHARRLQWGVIGSLVPVLLPFSLYAALAYVVALRRTDGRPPNHGNNLWSCVAILLIAGFWVVASWMSGLLTWLWVGLIV